MHKFQIKLKFDHFIFFLTKRATNIIYYAKIVCDLSTLFSINDPFEDLRFIVCSLDEHGPKMV